MKRIIKRSLSLIIAVVMCLSLFSMTAFAEELSREKGWHTDESGYSYYVDDYGNIYWDTSGINPTDPNPTDPNPSNPNPTNPPETQNSTGSTSNQKKPSIQKDSDFEIENGVLIHFVDYQSTYLMDYELYDLTIPTSVTSIGERAFNNRNEIASVIIPSSVTSIENSAFNNCSGLSSVTLSDGLISIGDYAFMGYNALTSIVIPNSVTTIGEGAFSNCTNLTSVTLSDSLISIGQSAFASCNLLTSITIPDSVTSIGYGAFSREITIYGTSGSVAEDYAKNAGCKFVSTGVTTNPLPIDTTKNLTDQPQTSQITRIAPGLDTASSWAHEQINEAYTIGLIPTSLQSNYTQATTRAEFCALSVALYETVTGTEITARKTFDDTKDVNVEKAAAIGVVSGVGDNKFDPNAKLTREQAAVMLARLAEAVGKPLTKQAATFADNSDISSWAIEAVGQVQAAGIMSGVGENMFAPKSDYTREQSIVTINRLYGVVK